jgi:2',3'-cyclic-nucleotide 2'-phosphodiesterase (5'-nucleotidase family)
MIPKRMLLISLAVVGILHGACEVFNDSCPVTTPEVWGQINVDLDIRRDYVRRCEAPVGNFLADSLLNFEYDLQDPETDPPGLDINVRVALFNAGAIRDEVRCGAAGETRERIPKGAVTDQDVYQLMPFYQDAVVVVKMKGGQFLKVLERGVASLHLEGKLSAEGHFLHVAGESGIQVDVDCSGDPQTLDSEGINITAPGSRIKRVQIGESSVIDPDAVPPEGLDNIFYVATLDYLVGTDDNGVPNDGFAAFQEGDIVVFETHRPVIDIVKWWLQSYPAEQDYPGVDNTYPRLDFSDCEHTGQYCEVGGD